MNLLSEKKGRVAMVFEGKKLPTKWSGFEVIDGDAYDMRYIDFHRLIYIHMLLCL